MIFRFTRLFVAAGLIGAVWLLITMRRPEARTAGLPVAVRPGRVKILQFYASTGTVIAGDRALLCYGVENARNVKISPPVEQVAPALSRCVSVSPEHTTHYTLLAEGYDGTVVTQSFTLQVNAAPPAPPQILHFAAEPAGAGAKLCYSVAHTARTCLQPAEAECSTESKGCFTVTPSRTTTYTLVAFGRTDNRKARRQIIVEVVPPRAL